MEKILPMPHILADAIILLTVAKGQRHEVNVLVFVYLAEWILIFFTNCTL